MTSFRRAQWALIVGILLNVMGCASHKEFLRVERGMTKGQVVDLIGEPDDRNFSKQGEDWYYSRQMFPEGRIEKIVHFDNGGRVVRLSNNELAKQRQHEIQRAKAGSTKININQGMSGMSDVASLGFACSGQNIHGRYARGGGCNIHGCWPPGGSCNMYGCSTRGTCSMTGCPSKVVTFNCR